MKTEILKAVDLIRAHKPLILNHTNYVTMDFMANSLLAVGAAPIMTVCEDEIAELVKIAACVNINIGTLDADFVKRSEKIITFAKQYKKPVIFDPVGAGATAIRTRVARQFLDSVDIIKGNASEIMALVGANTKPYGVETANTIDDAREYACILAQKHKITVAVSGAVDFITDGVREATVPFGSPLMTQVTGMGCVLGAIIAAFRAVINNNFLGAKYAMQYFALCGEFAATVANKPAALQSAFIDALYAANFSNRS